MYIQNLIALELRKTTKCAPFFQDCILSLADTIGMTPPPVILNSVTNSVCTLYCIQKRTNLKPRLAHSCILKFLHIPYKITSIVVFPTTNRPGTASLHHPVPSVCYHVQFKQHVCTTSVDLASGEAQRGRELGGGEKKLIYRPRISRRHRHRSAAELAQLAKGGGRGIAAAGAKTPRW